MGQLTLVAYSMSCLTAQMLSAVPLPGVKPARVGSAMLNMYPFSLSYIQCAYILYAVSNKLMPLYPGPEGSLCGFSMWMMMDMPQSIGKIQSVQMIMIIRKSKSLAIAEYLYTSAGMSSHAQARFIFSQVQALSTSFSVRSSSEVSNAGPSKMNGSG